MSKLNSAKLNEVFEKAITDFDAIQSALRDERQQCLDDRRFYSISGAMWEGPLGQQFENKPKIEVNKVHLSVIRIFNEYRNNRIAVNFVPKDGKPNELTDVCAGLYRADEQDSTADEAHDNAFEEGTGGGFGAWRLRNVYEEDDEEVIEGDERENTKQRIKIEPIFDAESSVFFDLSAQRQDKADAKYCYVLTAKPRRDFLAEYKDNPNADIASTSWHKIIEGRRFDWLTPDVVYIAEYYVKEKIKKTVAVFEGLLKDIKEIDLEELEDEDEGADLRKELAATGYKEIKRKKFSYNKVHKYIMSGGGILEDLGFIAGKHIPIIPFYGKRWFIDNIERCQGHVRLAKDAQRLKNMQLSTLAEIAAKSTVEKPIFFPQQMAGNAQMWADDNVKNYPYLMVNPMKDAEGNIVASGPIAYTKAPSVPPAMAAIMQIVDNDISEVLGKQEAGEEMQSNISGVAVELVHQKLDMQTFIYMSNMAKAIRREGEVWLSMARDIYVEDNRAMKTVDDLGEFSSITINEQGVNKETNIPETKNNISEANFDVWAIPGPTSASKRASTVRSLINLLQTTQDQETVSVITSMIMLNMEGEGIDNIREYFRKRLLKMGVIPPSQEEAAEMQQEAQNTPPDPNSQFLIASAEQAKADAMYKQANTVLAEARAELTKVQALKTAKDAELGQTDRILKAIDLLLQRDAAQNALAQSAAQNPKGPQE